MEALQGRDAQEDSPTVVHLTMYLLALDEQYDRQALELGRAFGAPGKPRSSTGCSRCSLPKRMPVLQLLRARRLPWRNL